jgi:hypothetical protein
VTVLSPAARPFNTGPGPLTPDSEPGPSFASNPLAAFETVNFDCESIQWSLFQVWYVSPRPWARFLSPIFKFVNLKAEKRTIAVAECASNRGDRGKESTHIRAVFPQLPLSTGGPGPWQ